MTEIQIQGRQFLIDGAPTSSGRDPSRRAGRRAAVEQPHGERHLRRRESWQHGRFDWLARGREDRYQDLSGFQTVPVNWSINTPAKRAFIDRVAAITGATGQSDRPTM
jgi:hypothetical protein